MPIVFTSLGGEGAGRCTGRLFVRPHYVAARFSTFSRGAKEGIWSLSVALPIDIFIAFFETWEGILYISIEIIIWQFSYHIPYQPLTHISPRAFGSRVDMGMIRKLSYHNLFIIYFLRLICAFSPADNLNSSFSNNESAAVAAIDIDKKTNKQKKTKKRELSFRVQHDKCLQI